MIRMSQKDSKFIKCFILRRGELLAEQLQFFISFRNASDVAF